MPKLLLNIAGLFGGKSILPILGLLLGCMLPLLLFQCTSSKLEDLREKHSALESEYKTVQKELNASLASLAQCRKDASLYDAVLLEHQKANIEIKAKYDRLREELMSGLLPKESLTPQEASNADNEPLPAKGGETAEADADFQAWCAQPVPLLVRGLLQQAAGPDLLP